MNDKQKALIFILLVSILGGATSPVTKIGLVSIPPLSFAFIRFLIAGILILPFLIGRKDLRSLWKLTPLSLLMSFNIILFILGLKTTTATISQILYAASPLLVALFLFILFKERITKKKTIGIAIGFLGVIIVVLLPVLEKGTKFSGDLLGNILIAGGAILSSLYLTYSKKAHINTFSPFIITSSFILVTCIVLFPLSLLESVIQSGWWNSLTLSSSLALIYISTASTILTYLLLQYSIKYGGSILASMQHYLVPPLAFLFSFLLLGEQLTTGLIVGGILALLGVYITTKK
ncbi:MAG: DMT family transporter [Candidatus Levybacteria bacterium]|nr:DMT family transporter [Candidatus Levybacteria bacterium]